MEEQFLDGEIGMCYPIPTQDTSSSFTNHIYISVITDANTLIQVTQTHLPEAVYQGGDGLSSHALAAPAAASVIEVEHDMHSAGDNTGASFQEEEDSKLHHSHCQPLSPTTSESSGSHSPTGSFGYPMGIAPSVHVIPPLESPNVTKSMHPDPSYLSGYYQQPYVSDKGSGFWPHASSAPQFGY